MNCVLTVLLRGCCADAVQLHLQQCGTKAALLLSGRTRKFSVSRGMRCSLLSKWTVGARASSYPLYGALVTHSGRGTCVPPKPGSCLVAAPRKFSATKTRDLANAFGSLQTLQATLEKQEPPCGAVERVNFGGANGPRTPDLRRDRLEGYSPTKRTHRLRAPAREILIRQDGHPSPRRRRGNISRGRAYLTPLPASLLGCRSSSRRSGRRPGRRASPGDASSASTSARRA